MSTAEALLDSNVLIAALTEDHVHFGPSARLLASSGPGRFAVAAHSYAETFSNLTRRSGPTPIGRSAGAAWTALEAITRLTVPVGLTPAQTLDAIRAYAASGGIGPRLYDHLIGQAAVHAGIGRIVTWNMAHMRGLFPELEVVEPPGAEGRGAD